MISWMIGGLTIGSGCGGGGGVGGGEGDFGSVRLMMISSLVRSGEGEEDGSRRRTMNSSLSLATSLGGGKLRSRGRMTTVSRERSRGLEASRSSRR